MPRNYKRTSNRRAWSKENLDHALKAVKDKTLSRRAAAKKFSIPESTLRGYLKMEPIQYLNELGRKPIFSEEMELQLASHLIKLSKCFYGLTTTETRRLAFDFAERNNVKNNFNKATGMAGSDWLRLFLRRNGQVSLRKPESTSLNRITAFNPVEIKIFFDNLTEVQEKFCFRPTNIFNMDETGITNVQKPPKILAAKGVKQLGAATSGERGRTVTVACCFSASGTYVPPFFIYPRARMTPLLEKNGVVGAKYACSKNGWMNENLFCEWLKHFKLNVNSSNEQPVLLILDNHTSHISLASFEYAKTNGIVIVTIPPHTSHKLQPLDLTFYGPLKNAYNKECSLYLKNHPYAQITMYEIAEIFKNAYMKVATLEKAISGFSEAGICPLNPEKFNEFDFDEETGHSNAEISKAIDNIHVNQGNIELENITEDPQPGSSNTEISIALDDLHGNQKNIEQGNITKNPQPGPSHTEISVKFCDLSPLPRKPKNKISVRKKQHSVVLTSTPMKKTLENVEIKRQSKVIKKYHTKPSSTRKVNKKDDIKQKSTPKVVKKDHIKQKNPPKATTKQNDKKKVKISKRLKKVTETKQKKAVKKQLWNETETETEESDFDAKLLDDDALDDIEGDSGKENKSTLCLYCNETGNQNEIKFICVFCKGVVHKGCSGSENDGKNFICDFCL